VSWTSRAWTSSDKESSEDFRRKRTPSIPGGWDASDEDAGLRYRRISNSSRGSLSLHAGQIRTEHPKLIQRRLSKMRNSSNHLFPNRAAGLASTRGGRNGGGPMRRREAAISQWKTKQNKDGPGLYSSPRPRVPLPLEPGCPGCAENIYTRGKRRCMMKEKGVSGHSRLQPSAHRRESVDEEERVGHVIVGAEERRQVGLKLPRRATLDPCAARAAAAAPLVRRGRGRARAAAPRSAPAATGAAAGPEDEEERVEHVSVGGRTACAGAPT